MLFIMSKKDLYNNYLVEIEKSLIDDNIESLDYLLEVIYTSPISEKDFMAIEEVLQESTLYSEFKEETYRETALELINNFK